ncbi:hypothetical protein CH373_00620 [Leptospira perolatii]|uniref:Uncharacterized protein n=1 Tax=Leptospira perolatii TaxID=2023191 RepID=A0A2M9ZR93_9LEPT|nr:hypothetical protein [Leptospira perolatii]PJZ71064.1 hypothetical protein CH360_00620 [Leptospira perolatii]PJZ74596.1 hypothetical protein CH373_00620 [Leptospira perolatii]
MRIFKQGPSFSRFTRLSILAFYFVFFSSCRGCNIQNYRNHVVQWTCDWIEWKCEAIEVHPDLTDCDPFHEEYEGFDHFVDRGILRDEYKIRDEGDQEPVPSDPMLPEKKTRERDKDTISDYGKNMRIDSKRLFERYDIISGRKRDYSRRKHPCSPIDGDAKPNVYYSEPKTEDKGKEF